jgi:nucleoporin POM152
MNGTPRLHSAFPVTPQTEGVRRRAPPRDSYTPTRNVASKLPSLSALKAEPADSEPAPVISPDIVSPATQRFSVFCVYLALWVWRLWDLWVLVQDDSESLWQFLKWLFIDSAFLFGVPAMRIPWLEWSSATVTALFIIHALVNGFLMFRIAVSLLKDCDFLLC